MKPNLYNGIYVVVCAAAGTFAAIEHWRAAACVYLFGQAIEIFAMICHTPDE